jgi:hypothetical protein
VSLCSDILSQVSQEDSVGICQVGVRYGLHVRRNNSHKCIAL